MERPELRREKATVTLLDVRIAVSVLLCCLTATALNALGLKFDYQGKSLEIIQKMTACISCLLCCQDSLPNSRKAGAARLIITAVGGAVGIAVSALDTAIASEALMVLLVTGGVLLTLLLCKVCGVPYINARIGGVTFILVSCTLGGTARIWYAVFRFVSTLYAALIVLLVSWIFQRFQGRERT